MPTSQLYQISTIMELIDAADPKSILDVGFGNGKYAFLAREYLELWNGALKREEWGRRIDGIEVFPEYLTPVHDVVFDNVYVGDAVEVLPGLEHRYELILLIDVLEHLDYEAGIGLLALCREKGRNVIVSTPKDIGDQGEVFGNSFEAHRFQWTRRHFAPFEKKFFVPNCFSYICFLGEDAAAVKRRCRSTSVRSSLSELKERVPLVADAWAAARRRWRAARNGGS